MSDAISNRNTQWREIVGEVFEVIKKLEPHDQYKVLLGLAQCDPIIVTMPQFVDWAKDNAAFISSILFPNKP